MPGRIWPARGLRTGERLQLTERCHARKKTLPPAWTKTLVRAHGNTARYEHGRYRSWGQGRHTATQARVGTGQAHGGTAHAPSRSGASDSEADPK